MNLNEALRLPEFNGLNDQQALDRGNETVVISTDTTPYTWSGIGEKLISKGVSAVDVVSFATGIGQLPGGAILDKCLASGGFNFGDPMNRALIQSFEVNEPQWAVDILNAMLAIGQTSGTFWAKHGISQPELADITAARATNAADDAETVARQAIVTFANEILNPLIASGTKQQIKTAVANW